MARLSYLLRPVLHQIRDSAGQRSGSYAASQYGMDAADGPEYD